MTQEIVNNEQPMALSRTPDDVLTDAKQAAQALVTVISQKKKPVMMNGEQYLEFEDWQTVGQFYNYTVSTGDAVPVEIEGVKGAKAYAKLVNFKTGEVVGGAESYCMRDEPNWHSKPWFQLASMAQTRAGAKALRNRLAWVVVLAGYRPTPAEEIQDMVAKQEPAVNAFGEKEHWCSLHEVAFFKRGKMKAFAHPIGDTGEWCHEHIPDAPEAKTTAETKKPVANEAYEPKSLKNVGEFLTACNQRWGLIRSEVEDKLNKSTVQLGDLQEEWVAIKKVMEG